MCHQMGCFWVQRGIVCLMVEWTLTESGVGPSVGRIFYGLIKVSLGDVCSLDDLRERMVVYLSQSNCHEILDAMTHVTKNIDEGRLKMKAHCPMVTDVGMKENALKILMGYVVF
ncbi:hypothetical protein HanIR_Chr04g0161211 [Helianthus annuus]|nr:hypothetical protein HanIR_Chr04g0161211 [Helianthus annuus]